MTHVDFISGHTFHGRKGAISNAFRYSVDFVMFDAEKTDEMPTLFSLNRGNLFSVRDRDHGGVPGQGSGASWARDVLQRHQIRADGALLLLAQPRALGYVFNPVSFWLAHDRENRLIAVIAEVTNTFKDRHSYLAVKPDQSEIKPDDRIVARKIFHVSPFQPIDGEYEFRFDIRDDRVGIWIDFMHSNGGVIATLTGPRRKLRNRDVVTSLIRRPFAARRVMALIHWQALVLWWKGAKYRNRPEPPKSEVSS